MWASRPTAARLPGARGAVSWVTLLVLVLLAGAGYLAAVFGPPLVLHYEVKQVVRDYANRSVKDPNDARLLEGMLQKIRSLQEVAALDEAGRQVRVPAVDLRPDEVVWERLADPPTLHVAFEYVRVLDLPFLDRTVERTYRVDESLDIRRADWGPAR